MYQQRYDAAGNPVGSETRVNSYTSGDQTYAAVSALTDGGWVVVWQSAGQDGSGLGVYGQVFNADGTRRGGEVPITQTVFTDQYNPVVTSLADGDFLVSWGSIAPSGGYALFGRRFQADGKAVGGEFQISAASSGNLLYPEIVARADGGFAAAWLEYDNSTAASGDYELLMRSFTANTTVPLLPAHDVLTTTGSDVVVTALFDSAHAQGDRWTSAGLQQLVAYEFKDMTDGLQSGWLSVDGVRQAKGQSIVVSSADLSRIHWSAGTGIGTDTVQIRGFDGQQWSDWTQSRVTTQPADGPLNAQQTVKVAGALPGEWITVSTLTDGGSVVAWSSALLNAGADVMARRYDAQGNAVGGTFTVNSTTTYDQGRPFITALKDGGFVVT
ncbi:hypothetical protein, partial [Azospirillum sp. Sh1]|uniref:hypothetical protein n=1 Tax=Azospirillum sp. Sh1 TaxID=2607285 RepID=UPI00125206CC